MCVCACPCRLNTSIPASAHGGIPVYQPGFPALDIDQPAVGAVALKGSMNGKQMERLVRGGWRSCGSVHTSITAPVRLVSGDGSRRDGSRRAEVSPKVQLDHRWGGAGRGVRGHGVLHVFTVLRQTESRWHCPATREIVAEGSLGCRMKGLPRNDRENLTSQSFLRKNQKPQEIIKSSHSGQRVS